MSRRYRVIEILLAISFGIGVFFIARYLLIPEGANHIVILNQTDAYIGDIQVVISPSRSSMRSWSTKPGGCGVGQIRVLDIPCPMFGDKVQISAAGHAMVVRNAEEGRCDYCLVVQFLPNRKSRSAWNHLPAEGDQEDE